MRMNEPRARSLGWVSLPMARKSNYEVYAKQGREWVLCTVHHDREPAMVQARTLLERTPETEVQILEEVFDPRAREVVTALVFRGNQHAFLNRDVRRTASVRPLPRPTPPAIVVGHGVPTRVVVYAASAAAVGAACLTVLGMWAIRAHG